MKERNSLLDLLKWFAILLVVIWHSIQYTQNTDFDNNFLFRIIYSFHMPLFMFISGWLSYETFDGSIHKLYKRFYWLIVPFFSWFIISFLFTCFLSLLKGDIFPNFLFSFKKLLISPDVGLWFLLVLFLNYFILFLSSKISPKREELVVFIIYLALNIFLHFTKLNYLGIGLVCWHLLFYLFGYVVNKYRITVKMGWNIWAKMALIIYPVLVVFWYRNEPPIFLKDIDIGSFGWWMLNSTYKILVPISGIVFFYTFFEWFVQFQFMFKESLLKLGKLSMEIYVTHFYFFSLIYFFGNMRGAVYVIFICIITLTGALIMQTLIKKSEILSRLLFGRIFVPK